MDRMTEVQAVQALRELGISPGDFATVRHARDLKEATRKLAALKACAKRGFREAAMRLHPDRNPGDMAKEEMFKLVTEAHRQIQALRVRPPVVMSSPRPRRWPATTVRTSDGETTTTLYRNGVRVRIRVAK